MLNGNFVSKTKYVKNLVKRFGLHGTKHAKPPMHTTLKLTKNNVGTPIEHIIS